MFMQLKKTVSSYLLNLSDWNAMMSEMLTLKVVVTRKYNKHSAHIKDTSSMVKGIRGSTFKGS